MIWMYIYIQRGSWQVKRYVNTGIESWVRKKEQGGGWMKAEVWGAIGGCGTVQAIAECDTGIDKLKCIIIKISKR